MTDTISINGDLVSQSDLLDASRLMAHSAHDAATVDQFFLASGGTPTDMLHAVWVLSAAMPRLGAVHAEHELIQASYDFSLSLHDSLTAHHRQYDDMTHKLVSLLVCAMRCVARQGVTLDMLEAEINARCKAESH